MIEPSLESIWKDFLDGDSPTARDRLIVNYAPLVKYVAGRVGAGLPNNVEHADLVSYGMFGLIDAISRFDPGRGYKFETFAIPRIKGAILDELRAMDWVPRSVRARARSVEKAIAEFESEHGRSPEDEEVAAAMAISVEEFHRLLSDVSLAGINALDETLGGERGDSVTLGDTVADSGPGPVGQFEVQEMRHILAESINRLSEREKIVLTLYYYEGMTLAEIGEVLGVTESRVCQIHTKAVLHMRSRLSAADRG
ncbi:MAG: FliA/WhiG family RNA polymerase sigma factor [Acidimicrobiales bacterium]